MVRVRFVGGSPAQIMDTQYSFTTYGQSAQMSDELFTKAKAGRVHLVTEEEFQTLGHPSEELKKHARFDTHRNAPEEFKQRMRSAWGICQAAANEPAAQVAEEEANAER